MPKRSKINYDEYFPEPSKRLMEMQRLKRIPTIGIKENIQLATTPERIHMLLDELAKYDHIHPSTVRKCEREAEKRVIQLAEIKKTKSNETRKT